MLKFNGVMVGTENVDKLVPFYKEVYGRDPDWASDDGNFAGWMSDGNGLMLGYHDKVKGTSANPERIIIGFETDKVEDEFNRIKAIDGAKVVAEPYSPKAADDMTLATVADPDGNYLQLNTPMEA